MNALVKYEKGTGHVALMDMPEPVCREDQVILEVNCCGICGTDIHVYYDRFRNYPPVILGHEFTGKVVETGSLVTGVKKDENFSVLGAIAVTCGKCSYCYRGEFMFCRNRRGMGHGVNGAFAKYVAVRPDQCYRIPDGVSVEEAALVEPLAAAVHAVAEIANFKLGDTVMVSGPGPIGMLCVKLLLAQGIKTIVAGTSADRDRLDMMNRFGVAGTVMVDREDLAVIIDDETKGAGVDVAIECAGAEGSVGNCMHSLRPLGQYIQVGHFGKDLRVPWDLVAFRQLHVKGSVGYTRETWDQTIKILEQGSIHVKDLITHHLALTEWQKGFDLFEEKKAIKVLLYPDLGEGDSLFDATRI